MFERVSTCFDVLGCVWTIVQQGLCSEKHQVAPPPSSWSAQRILRWGWVRKFLQGRDPSKPGYTNQNTNHLEASPPQNPQTNSSSFHVVSSQQPKLEQNPARSFNPWQHMATICGSARLQPAPTWLQPGSNPAPTLLDMTRATVVLPVPGAPEKTKCPSSGTSEPSWQPLASSVNGCQRSLCFRLITLAYLLFHNTLKSGFEVKGTWLAAKHMVDLQFPAGHGEGIAHLLEFWPQNMPHSSVWKWWNSQPNFANMFLALSQWLYLFHAVQFLQRREGVLLKTIWSDLRSIRWVHSKDVPPACRPQAPHRYRQGPKTNHCLRHWTGLWLSTCDQHHCKPNTTSNDILHYWNGRNMEKNLCKCWTPTFSRLVPQVLGVRHPLADAFSLGWVVAIGCWNPIQKPILTDPRIKQIEDQTWLKFIPSNIALFNKFSTAPALPKLEELRRSMSNFRKASQCEWIYLYIRWQWHVQFLLGFNDVVPPTNGECSAKSQLDLKKHAAGQSQSKTSSVPCGHPSKSFPPWPCGRPSLGIRRSHAVPSAYNSVARSASAPQTDRVGCHWYSKNRLVIW